MKKNIKKKTGPKVVLRANVYIKSTFNNTILSATDEQGNVFGWSTTGKAGFKGSKKSTPYAATQAAKILVDRMKDAQTEEIKIFVSGVSSGRDAAVRAFGAGGFRISQIKDVTPVAHNGCRAKKPRRV